LNREIINILFNFLPEISLALTIIILNVTSGLKTKSGTGYFIFIAGITGSVISAIAQAYYFPQSLFSGVIAADHFAYGARVIITSAMLFVAIALCDKESLNDLSLVLISAIGALLSVSSSDIFVLFISLEVMIIPLYLLIYYSIRPAIKYFITSGVFMAAMLYGFTLLYGISGTGNMTEIAKFLSFNPYNNLVLIIAVILVTSGLSFISLSAPFNLSFPMLTEKIRIPHLAQFAVINITAILFVMLRFFTTIFHDYNTFINDPAYYNIINSVNWQLMLAVISGISVVAGNFIILWQYNLRKIFSYIIIAQAGYILMGIVSAKPDGINASIYNIMIAVINSLGLLYTIHLINQKYSVTEITGLKGSGRNDKFLFLSFIFFLISLAGFPLSGGFTGKIMLYISLGSTGYFWLIASGILSSAVFLYFIFRLSISLFSGYNVKNSAKTETKQVLILLFLIITDILSGFYIEPFLNWVKYISITIGN